MQAYNKSDLYNKYVQEQAAECLQTTCITNESYNKILQAHPCKLYTPNYFIKIALGLLTIVAILFSGLLLWLLSSSAINSAAIATLLIVLAIICYITLELLVKGKRYYNAGVDNVLMIMVIVFIVSALLASDFETSWIVISSVTMVISLWLSIRFIDAFMAMVSYCCFFIFLFLVYLKAGDIAKATAPLIMMAVSALVYFVMKKFIENKPFVYQHCFKTITLLTLVTFYASGNYFIVKEVSDQMFHFQVGSNDHIPFGWLFWIFTLTIPPAYIIYGIIKKDFLVMRTGLGLITATVFTVRYYYTFLSAEIEMLIAGVILIWVSYALIKYLKTPKYGFTSEELYPSKKQSLNVEALIIAETFNKQPAIEGPGLFGGGSGGGGGATGEY
ncbi:MAG: hypothetical protein ABIN97_15515 [Ginsengibacter sp.]